MDQETTRREMRRRPKGDLFWESRVEKGRFPARYALLTPQLSGPTCAALYCWREAGASGHAGGLLRTRVRLGGVREWSQSSVCATRRRGPTSSIARGCVAQQGGTPQLTADRASVNATVGRPWQMPSSASRLLPIARLSVWPRWFHVCPAKAMGSHACVVDRRLAGRASTGKGLLRDVGFTSSLTRGCRPCDPRQLRQPPVRIHAALGSLPPQR